MSPGEFYFNEEPIRYGLHDMDRSGVPELIIYCGSWTHSQSHCFVYTYLRGEVRLIGMIGCNWYEGDCGLEDYGSKKYPGLIWSDAGTGIEFSIYYTVKNNRIVSELVEEYDVDADEYLNVTKDKALYKLFKTGKHKTFRMFTFDEIRDVNWAG